LQQRVKMGALAVTAAGVMSVGMGLAAAVMPSVSVNGPPLVTAQSFADSTARIPGAPDLAPTNVAASGVILVGPDGTKTSARTVAKGISARSLAANAFVPQDAPTTSREKTQGVALLLTSAAQPNRIQKIASGAFSPFAGTGVAGSLGDGGAASAAQFNLKTDSLVERSGIAIAADGTVFVADTVNSTIRRIASAASEASSEPGIVRGIAGRFAPAGNVSLSEPLGLAIDRLGNLYIADRGGNAVLELPNATSGTPGVLEILAQVASPANIAVTQDGSKLFVATDTAGAVFAIDTAKRTVSTVASFSGRENACASAGASGASVASAAGAICPAGLATDPRGNLYISDANANQLLRVNAADGRVVKIATNFRSPGAIASDANGNLYVADQARAEIVYAAADPGQSCVTGSSGVLQICPATNDFGSIVQGGTTPSTSFVLTNLSGTEVNNLTYSPALPSTNPPVQPPTSPYIVQNTSCVLTLAPNSSASSSCMLNMTFSPNATGAISGTLTVSDANPQDTVTSSLSGTGTNYQLQLASNQSQSMTVLAGETATYNFTLIPDPNFPYTGPVSIVCPPSFNPSNPSSNTNLPLLAYCVPPSSPVVLNAGATTSFTVAIETTSRSGVTSSARLYPSLPKFGEFGNGPFVGSNEFAAWVIAVMTVAFAYLCVGHFVRRRIVRAVFAVLALALSGAAFSACGGGTKLVVDGTPAGTSNLLIQATAQGTGRSFTVQMIVK
jgi:sugar lactone lactonase YvrE